MHMHTCKLDFTESPLKMLLYLGVTNDYLHIKTQNLIYIFSLFVGKVPVLLVWVW